MEVAEYAGYVVTGEGEYTLPRLLNNLENGGNGKIPGVVTGNHAEQADTCVNLNLYPAFSGMRGYVEISRGCPFSCGYCQTPQIFGHCMRHRSIDEVARYANRYGQARFVSPNAFAYGSDGIRPRWDKIEHLLRTLLHEIYFGTFPSEVRPEFVCDELLSLLNRVPHQYEAPFRGPVRKRPGPGSPRAGPFCQGCHPRSRAVPGVWYPAGRGLYRRAPF